MKDVISLSTSNHLHCVCSTCMSTVELLSRADEKAGRFWPWSKRRVQWILCITGTPVVVEITHSWTSGITRVYVNRDLIKSGTEPDFNFAFALSPQLNAVAIVTNCKPELEVDGWPVEWLAPRVRRDQASRFSVFAQHGYYPVGSSTVSSASRLPLL